MVGQITYTEDQILFVLRLTLDKVKGAVILTEYEKRFNKTLTASQLRYVKSKYGHDPEFGTALINGTLPSNGGNRKTAPSTPRRSTVISRPVQDFNQPAIQTAANAYSLAPLASASHHQLDAHLPSPSTTFSRHPQQNTQQQSPPQPSNHSHPGLTLALPGMPAAVTEMPAWDPDNPYGVQPVLQQYNRELRSKPTKRSHSDFEDAVKEEQGPEDTETIDPKRLKLESPMIVPKFEDRDDEAVFLLQTDTPDAPSPLEIYQGPEADKLIDELLDQIDAEMRGQEPTMPSISTTLTQPAPPTVALTAAVPPMALRQATPYLQAPQMDFYSPYNYDYGLANYGMETAMYFSNPASDASNPSLIFSETDTNPAWSPYLDNVVDNSHWGNTPNLSTYALPNLVDLDTVVDPTLASYMDPALLSGLSSGGDITTESHNQMGNVTDFGITSPVENQSGGQSNAEAFMGFDWDQMLNFDGNAGSFNDEFQQYPPLE
ncbi:hypothetical protein CkaCkLH20_06832 [Colletotrichum karsti]|uniref:Clr5 domain-containing protein n=1 Tax=Colletotrichum karsti TaxID=1095194 RepID=A0A9P6I4Y5_9PEZI|nr:uncharacterized protein CkaCkLH20_06832 [Colletotrichum karsti]KAF9875900.1 hypothetical protein CkaCkLH20_06832 [Colletotrichum karsti]